MTQQTIEADKGGGVAVWYQAARRVAIVAGIYCVVVLALLLANSLRGRSANPAQTTRIQELQIALNRNPGDEKLRSEVRALDSEIRSAYFRTRTFAVNGLYMLLGGIVVYLIAMEAVKQGREKAPMPDAKIGSEALMSAALGRRAVAALAAGFGGLLLTLAVLSRHDLAFEYARAAEKAGAIEIGSTHGAEAGGTVPAPAPGAFPLGPQPTQSGAAAPTAPGVAGTPGPALPAPAGTAPLLGGATAPATVVVPLGKPGAGAVHPATAPGKPAAAIAAAYPADWAANWPVFRGPEGAGVATVQAAPEKWNGASGAGIRWKSAVPLPGWNSPVVWGDRIFLTGANKAGRAVFCYDARTGKLAWKRAVPGGWGALKVMDDTGYAPSTAVTNGKVVCAIFPNGDLAGVDFAGKLLWTRKLGLPENNYGHAASLTMAAGHLIVQYDQGGAPEEAKSALLAINPSTGKNVWVAAKRPAPNSWSTPIVIRVGQQQQIVTAANPWLIGYEAATGKEVWRAQVLGGEVAPSPAFAGGCVIVANQGAAMVAVRPDGTGDVTKTHVVWTATDNLPDIASPVASGDYVFLTTSEGMITCFEAATGKKLWEHAFENGGFKASPAMVGGKLYALDVKGVMHILEAGRGFKELGTAALGEDASASPAFVGDHLFIRGAAHLFCIGGKG